MLPLRDTLERQKRAYCMWAIVAVNSCIFLGQAILPPSRLEAFVFTFGLVPARFLSAFTSGDTRTIVAQIGTAFTCMFLHGGLFHIVFNMWSLWIFGPALEELFGPTLFLLFYLACGIAAAAAHALVDPTSNIPCVGASGAIAGVMGAYAWLFPRSTVITVVPVLVWPLFLEVYAGVFTLLWFVIQILEGTSITDKHGVGGVAWWAHIGGFAAGFAMAAALSMAISPPPPPVEAEDVTVRWVPGDPPGRN